MDSILAELPTDNEWYRQANIAMEGIANSLRNSTRNPQMITNLKWYLEEMDRRRGTVWQEYFPWLIPEFKKL
jgi:hypothetical protein